MAELPELIKEQWQEYLERLTKYTVGRFRYLGWLDGRIGPKGKGPQDIALDAILSVLNGKRRYNREAYPNFMDFLKSVADSCINHFMKLAKDESKIIKPTPTIITEQGKREEVELEDKGVGVAQICVNKEIAEKVKNILSQEFSDDLAVKGILECLEAGITKDSDMAEILGIDVKDIYNAKKRLQRGIDKNLSNMKMEYRG